MASEEGQQHPLKIYYIMWISLFVLSGFSYWTDFWADGPLRTAAILTFMMMKAGGIVTAQESPMDIAQSVCREVLQDFDQFEPAGQTAFTRTPLRAFSWAAVFVSPRRIRLPGQCAQ